MFKGVCLFCQPACIHMYMYMSEMEDDIIGPDPIAKALYLIERALEDDITLTEHLTDMIVSWFKEDSSKCLEFTTEIGSIKIVKQFTEDR